MPIRFETEKLEIQQKVRDFLEEWNAPSLEIIVYTSGSTGKPKEIRLQKAHMIASAKATGKFLGVQKGDSALLCLSMDTIGGRMMVVRALVLELNLIVSDVSSNPLSLIDEELSFAAMVPLQLEKSLQESPEKLERIGKLIIGGGPVSNELIGKIQDARTEIYHTFGMTETISHIAMRKLNHPLENEFHCLPGIEISEIEQNLIIEAPQIGVHRLQTNDVIERISQTSFRWLGRSDFVINSGGIKLHPEQIESKLAQIIAFPFFVFGEKDAQLGEKLILLIEHESSLELTKTRFKEVLPPYSIPKEIRYVNQFTFTESGKINRLISQQLPHVAHEVL